MAKYSPESQALIDFLQDRPIAYHPRLARAFGSVNAGVWLGQVLFWSGKSTECEDGWFRKIAKEFEEETALSEREQETARAVCTEAGVVEYERRGIPAMPHYRVDFDKLIAVLVEKGDKSRLGKRHSEEQDGRETPNKMGASQGSQDGRETPLQLSEITSESCADALTTSDSPDQVVQPSLFVEPATEPSEKCAQHNADGSGRAVPPRRAAAEHNDKPPSAATAITKVYKATVENMGYMTSMANAKQVYTELGALDPATDEMEAGAAIMHCCKEWPKDRVMTVRFDKLPSMIRTYRGGRKGQPSSSAVESDADREAKFKAKMIADGWQPGYFRSEIDGKWHEPISIYREQDAEYAARMAKEKANAAKSN